MNFYRDYNFSVTVDDSFLDFFRITFDAFEFLSSFSFDFYSDKQRFLTDSEIYFLISSLNDKVFGFSSLPTVFVEKFTGIFLHCYKEFMLVQKKEVFVLSFYSFFSLEKNNFSFSFSEKKISFLGFDFFIDKKIDCLIDKKINKITLSFVNNNLSLCVHTSFFKPIASIIHSKNLNEISVIGVDLGLKEFATLSNGEVINNLHFFKKQEEKVKYLQKKLAKCEFHSKNWFSYKNKLNKTFKHISNQRNDFFHKLSLDLVTRFDVICFEKLDIKSLSSKNRKSKNVLDASWATFIKMVEYKAKEYGKIVLFVDQFFPSSKKCSHCGGINKIDLSVRTYLCSHCNFEIDRDLNAAINIKNEAFSNFLKGISIS